MDTWLFITLTIIGGIIVWIGIIYHINNVKPLKESLINNQESMSKWDFYRGTRKMEKKYIISCIISGIGVAIMIVAGILFPV